jgi:hypothetical protein
MAEISKKYQAEFDELRFTCAKETEEMNEIVSDLTKQVGHQILMYEIDTHSLNQTISNQKNKVAKSQEIKERSVQGIIIFIITHRQK